MINLTDDSRMPITSPIQLVGEHLDRYLEIRMLRLLFDQSGHRPITWNPEGEAVPGQWKLRPHKM
ncbi:MAG: hypothetical protein ACRCUY_00255 [Thermoguttaceae bacterium]